MNDAFLDKYAAKEPLVGRSYDERPSPCRPESERAREAREAIANAVVEEMQHEPRLRHRPLSPAARRLEGV